MNKCKKKMIAINKEYLAYIAGYLDGEGCFYVGRNWKILIACETTYYPTIKWLHRLFGGSFVISDRKRKFNHRPTYRWSVAAHDAERVCLLVIPYLQEKKKQAELLLKLQNLMGLPLNGKFLDKNVVRERDKLSIRIKELKGRL